MENKNNENLIMEADATGPVDEEKANMSSMVELNKIKPTEKESDKENIARPVKDGWAEINEFFSAKL